MLCVVSWVAAERPARPVPTTMTCACGLESGAWFKHVEDIFNNFRMDINFLVIANIGRGEEYIRCWLRDMV